MEMVTEPVIPDAKTAKKFCQNFQQILKYLDISNANMEKGEMRCEANISVQEKGKWKYEGNCEIKPKDGYKLNPKIEVKNINSFKAVEKAIEYEIKRQTKAIKENEALKQETRGWDEDKAKTFSQRSKETSADYRYFPEPDIPPISIDGQWIKKIKTDLVELPLDKKKRFIEQYSFLPENAEILVSSKKLANYTEQVISELRAWVDSSGDSWERQKKKLARATSNWIINNLFNFLNGSNDISGIKISPENMAELISLVYQDKVNSSSAQKILKIMYEKGGDPTNIMDELGLEQVDNGEELSEEIKKIIKNNPSQVEEYKNGKENLLQYFVGQTMAATKGKANPKKIIEILKKELN
jgi:aspartyl-tRNA(Asn)/glutamyl-tRNA(Gln) amidotransferase subunit B